MELLFCLAYVVQKKSLCFFYCATLMSLQKHHEMSLLITKQQITLKSNTTFDTHFIPNHLPVDLNNRHPERNAFAGSIKLSI